MESLQSFLKRKNIVFSAKRYGIDALAAMAQGLFCSLLIGTIIRTLGQQLHIGYLADIGTYAMSVSGPAMAVAIGYALQADPMVLFSLAAVGWSANAEGGAAVAGCCAQMVGFAVLSFRENRWGGIVSQGLGTSMLQMGNIIHNPRVWIAPCLASIITGPIATCVFHLEMNGAAVNSGMGTCGLCGPIGIWTGWAAPSEKAISNGAQALTPGAMDWLGLVLICFVLPALLCWLFGRLERSLGWIKDGDLKL